MDGRRRTEAQIYGCSLDRYPSRSEEIMKDAPRGISIDSNSCPGVMTGDWKSQGGANWMGSKAPPVGEQSPARIQSESWGELIPGRLGVRTVQHGSHGHARTRAMVVGPRRRWCGILGDAHTASGILAWLTFPLAPISTRGTAHDSTRQHDA
ncbi:hypothetical protein B0H19DRAFT_1078131 [Mycena capillaripes]|nr:hypothetical protein B0H19DRAFT_1078131 [Mycena capillaripes]